MNEDSSNAFDIHTWIQVLFFFFLYYIFFFYLWLQQHVHNENIFVFFLSLSLASSHSLFVKLKSWWSMVHRYKLLYLIINFELKLFRQKCQIIDHWKWNYLFILNYFFFGMHFYLHIFNASQAILFPFTIVVTNHLVSCSSCVFTIDIASLQLYSCAW